MIVQRNRNYHSRLVHVTLLGCLALLLSAANAELFSVFNGVDRTDVAETETAAVEGEEEEMVSIMVGFRDSADEGNYVRKQRMNARNGQSKSKINYRFQNTHGLAMEVTRAEYEEMKKDPTFSTVEEDHEVRLAPSTIDTSNITSTLEEHERWLQEAKSYGVALTQSDQAIPVPPSSWSKCVVYVCIVDSGVFVNHQDIPYARGDGYTDGEAFGQAAGDQWWNPISTPHGSNVAGIMFAQGGNNAGMVGVIPQHPRDSKVCLRVAKVFPNGKEVTAVSTILQGKLLCMEWLLSLLLVANPSSSLTRNTAVEWCAAQTEYQPMVINLSLATEMKTSTEEQVYNKVYDKGILLVAAAGNLGNAAVSYPASHRAVISVGSVNANKQRSSFSQYNNFVELVGPGTDVLVTNDATSGLSTKSGTSFAAPYVAAIAARIWSSFPHCSNEQVRSALRDTALRLGNGVPNQEYGYGLVQAVYAFNNMISRNCNIPTKPPTPPPTAPPTPPPTRGPTPPPTPYPTGIPSVPPTNAPSMEPTAHCNKRLQACEHTTDCCEGLVCSIDSTNLENPNWVCRSGTADGRRNKPRLSAIDNRQCRGGFANGCSKYDSW